jgi:hypothetical protein
MGNTSWHETTTKIAEETKTAEEQIEKMAKQLKRVRGTRVLTEGSVEYAIDSTLCANGSDRKVYQGQCLIAPQIQKLLANRVIILSQLEAKFLWVREQTLERDTTTNLALIEEIKEERAFFGQILHCYDCVFVLLFRTRTIFSAKERTPFRTRTIFSAKERTELQGAIEILKSLWPTQRIWKKKAASVTPKSHDLWFEIQLQLTYLGRFYHFMEDPIKKLHKIDRLMDAVYCHLQDYEFREASKK